MKNILFILIIMLWLPALKAEKTMFLLNWKILAQNKDNSDKLDLFCDHFEAEFNNGIEKYFPCATKTSYRNIATILAWERDKQLLGAGDDDALQNLAGAMGAQYLVSLKMTQLGQTVVMNAICIHMKNAKH